MSGRREYVRSKWRTVKAVAKRMVRDRSRGFEKCFEAASETQALLIAIEQSDLIDKDGSQGKALGISESFGWHLTMAIEDAFELLIEVFDSG